MVINDSMTTWDNTRNIETKAYRRIWILKRLVNLGCPKDDLIMVYTRQVRTVCEFAAPFWGTMITQEEARRIERIQRTALHVILGESFTSYKDALLVCGIKDWISGETN